LGDAIQVLVIEDNVEMSAEIIARLAACGFQPKPCFDGTQGPVLALRGRFNAITPDHRLPGDDGLNIASGSGRYRTSPSRP
jgi:DNA-binding response OmpR family regulator